MGQGQDWGDPQVPPQWQQRRQEPQWGQYGREQQPRGYAPPWEEVAPPPPYQGPDPYWNGTPHQSQGPYRGQGAPQDWAPYQDQSQHPSGYWPQQPQYSQGQYAQTQYPQPSHPQDQPHRRAPRRRGTAWAMWGIGAVVLLAASTGATVVLRHHNAAAAKPLTCKQQYAAWKTGPARAKAVKVQADAKTLSAAGSSEDIKTMLSSFKAIGADAISLQAYPMPACADPKGYWPQVLADMKAAGDNADSGSGLSGLLLAEAPLKNVNTLESKLTAELKKTAGLKS